MFVFYVYDDLPLTETQRPGTCALLTTCIFRPELRKRGEIAVDYHHFTVCVYICIAIS